MILLLLLLFITISYSNSSESQELISRDVFVHFDLKGAPPRVAYFKELLSVVSELGATGVVIEWEDMFPFKGKLGEIINGNAYSVDEVYDILSHANSLGLIVMPLIQSLGHMEWILKTKQYAHLREDPSYPMVACIGDIRSLDVVLDVVNQVMNLHSKFATPYIHIGADEAFQIGICDADKRVLPKYGNDTKKLVFDHIRKVATNINENFARTQVLMWFDEFKSASSQQIKEYELNSLVVPIVWKYTSHLDKDLPAEMWSNLSHSFSTVWGASAFKGADGSNTYWNRMKPYIQNNKQWFVQAGKYADLFKNFQGIIMTGWQRYDHFSSLCELWPTSVPSLAVDINIIRNYIIAGPESENILKILHCPDGTTLNDVIGGIDKCRFPGWKVRDAIREFINIKQFHENSSWVHNRENGWLQSSHMILNASNPFYIDAIGKVYDRAIKKLDANKEKLRQSMDEIFFEDVSIEFITDYVQPFYDDLTKRLAAVNRIDTRRSYPARPWFRNNENRMKQRRRR